MRIEDSLPFDLNIARRGIDAPKETAAETFMTGCSTDLVDTNEERVGIAIEIDGLQLLHIATFLPFTPQFLAAAAVVANASRPQCLLIGFAIHIRQHENIPRGIVLGNDRNQRRFVEIGTVGGFCAHRIF